MAPQTTTTAILEARNSPEDLPRTDASLHNSCPDSVPSSPKPEPRLSSSNEYSASQIEARIRAIIDEDIASIVFEGFATNMLPQLPFLAFSPAMEARDVWKNTPIIFLAILDVAADGFCELEVSRNLRKLLVQIYSTCFLGATAYNLSLLQAFIISAAWHRAIEPPQPGEHTDVHQISHAAASMAIIMGLGKSPKTQTRSGPMPVQERKLYGPASTYDSTSLEARRIWLGCHYVCSKYVCGFRTTSAQY